MRVSIGIPTYNGARRLDALLSSIALRTPMVTFGAAHVVVVDDGSPKQVETRDVVARWRERLPLDYIERSDNRGISASWNAAVRKARARDDSEIVVLINDDVIVPSGGWLEALVHALDTSPGVGVVGASWHAFTDDDVPALLASVDSDMGVVPRDPTNKVPDASRRERYEDTWPGRVMCPTGQLFAFRRSDFNAIGGFDETFLSFYEESDFGTSMASRGLIGMQLTWPFCWHMWSQTFKENPNLRAHERMQASRAHYRAKWGVPDGVAEFDFTGAKHFATIGDVSVSFLRRSGTARGVLRRDGAFVEAP